MTTLLPPQAVAERAGISPKTLYQWLKAEPPLVTHTHDVQGRPVFTEAEAQQVAATVRERRAAKAALRVNIVNNALPS